MFWSVVSCIQSEYRKILTRKNSLFEHFSRSEGLDIGGKPTFEDLLVDDKFDNENVTVSENRNKYIDYIIKSTVSSPNVTHPWGKTELKKKKKRRRKSMCRFQHKKVGFKTTEEDNFEKKS